MLEEALPVAAGVAVALLPCMAFGGLSAARGFMILGGGEAGGGGRTWAGGGRARRRRSRPQRRAREEPPRGGGGRRQGWRAPSGLPPNPCPAPRRPPPPGPPPPNHPHPPPVEESGFFKAIEEGKSEEEALALAQGGQPTIATPYEARARAPRAPAAAAPVVAPSVLERRAAAPSYGFAARFLQ
jgi:hypothetical protein